jgi:hypothetical protein
MNIGPMPSPRDSILANLNEHLDHYFGGKTVQEIAPGVTGVKSLMFPGPP